MIRDPFPTPCSRVGGDALRQRAAAIQRMLDDYEPSAVLSRKADQVLSDLLQALWLDRLNHFGEGAEELLLKVREAGR